MILFYKKNNCYDETNNIIEYATGLKRPNNLYNDLENIVPINMLSDIPLSWDWRDLTGNIQIRNQGGCGSC